jgi:hypothetical protein
MKEPRITVHFDVDMDVYIEAAGTDHKVRIARVESEGIRFLTAWEGDDAFEASSLWPSNLRALAESLPAITRVIERAQDDLLAIQEKLNEGQRVAQSDIDALNADS